LYGYEAIPQEWLVVIMAWIEKEHEKATKETE
jgi:hypothetical protein